MVDFEKILQENLNLFLLPSQLEVFQVYEYLLLEWNRKFNLTAITDPDEVRIKHFYDSLTCLKFITEDSAAIVDIGCGAGFPGIPLKIVKPDLKLVLVDAVRKKTDFCRAAVETLGLADTTVIHARAEDLGRDTAHREKYDWAIARAVAPLPVLAEFLLPLVHPGGNALAQKGGNIEIELNQSTKAISILGGCEPERLTFKLPGSQDARSLLKIEKVNPTPSKYPRKAGLPAKKPL